MRHSMCKTVCLPINPRGRREVPAPLHHIKFHNAMCTGGECECAGIKIVDEAKYFSIILDGSLNWSKPIDYIVPKLRRVVFSLVDLRRYIPRDALRELYFALFQPVLGYGIGVYGGVGATVLDSLVRLQRQAIKVILSLPKRYPSEELCDLLGVLSFQGLYEVDLIRLFPLLLKDRVVKETRYNFRGDGSELLMLPLGRLEAVRKNLSYTLIDYFNKLNPEVRTTYLHSIH